MLRDPIALKLGFRSSNEDLKSPIVFFFLFIAIEASVHLPLRFLSKIQKTPLPLQLFSVLVSFFLGFHGDSMDYGVSTHEHGQTPKEKAEAYMGHASSGSSTCHCTKGIV